jgi:exonuclease III
MNLLSWNCRGLGNPQAVRDLCQLTKEKKPTILFLMETKCHRNKMEFVRVKLGFACMFVVDSVGRSGGLALLWHDTNLVEIQNYSRRHINAIVKDGESENSWKLTGFYGHPDWTKRHESWALLNHLRIFTPLPWLCVGDFNEITEQSEKTGVVLRRESQMSQFRDVLEDCHFSDLGFTGSKYTWTNCRQDGSFIKERLDRAVANLGWIQLYKKVEVHILAARTSDHKPLFISFTNQEEKGRQVQRGAKFEAKWLADAESRVIITDAWRDCLGGESPIRMVQQKLETCKSALRRWNGQKYGCAEKAIKKKTKELEILQKYECVGDGPDIKKLQTEIDFLLEQEDIRWKQRAKQNWYRQGDRNTPYFHSWASHRRKVNQIQKIQDDEGRIWNKPEEISKSFIDYYQDLFTTCGVHGVEECLMGLDPRVTDAMNGELLRNFSMVEVDAALKQMHPLKSPGPDGMSACFYQTAWSTIRHEVCTAVLEFLNGGSFEATINETYITLIPKIKNPSRITEYRPISLCNVLYKLIAKVLANRLKKVLPHIISANQSAFVPGRL